MYDISHQIFVVLQGSFSPLLKLPLLFAVPPQFIWCRCKLHSSKCLTLYGNFMKRNFTEQRGQSTRSCPPQVPLNILKLLLLKWYISLASLLARTELQWPSVTKSEEVTFYYHLMRRWPLAGKILWAQAAGVCAQYSARQEANLCDSMILWMIQRKVQIRPTSALP